MFVDVPLTGLSLGVALSHGAAAQSPLQPNATQAYLRRSKRTKKGGSEKAAQNFPMSSKATTALGTSIEEAK